MRLKMTRTTVLLFLVVSTLLGCRQELSKEQREAVSEELKEREIKMVKEGDIFEEVSRRGDLISATSQKTLGGHLMKAMNEEGVAGALQYCNINAYPLIDSLSRKYNARVRRVSLDLRNPKDAPDSLERLILESYAYSIEKGDAVGDNIQKAGDDSILFTRPILLSNGMCLNCHGSVGTEIKKEDHELLLSLYPADSATGHKMNDLRGAWSIKFAKKDIVKDL